MFFNRKYELSKIRELLKRDKPALIVLYGRRRCGKSTLIGQVLRKGDIYYQADRQESIVQRDMVVKVIEAQLGIEHKVSYQSWESLFIEMNRIIKPNQTFAIDEFPYILKNEPALPSILQRLIDGKKLKYNLILCGSAQNAMGEMVHNGKEPLYGRADAIFKIRPLEAGWIKEGLELSDEECVREYSVWGGIPRYWELRKEFKTFEAALEKLLFSRDALLLEEPMRLLLDDLRSAVQPYSILTLIGQGVHRPSEIAARLEKTLPSLADSFNKLMELGFIRREIPYGESIRSSKRTLYKMNDPFLSFYFRFVLPNKQRIELGMGKQILKRVMQQYDEYVSFQWEHLCRLSLPLLRIKRKEWDIASNWWGNGKDGKETEIDLLMPSINGEYMVYGEIKWSTRFDLKKALSQLDSNIENIKIKAPHKRYKVICTRRITTVNEDVIFVAPKDVIRVLR